MLRAFLLVIVLEVPDALMWSKWNHKFTFAVFLFAFLNNINWLLLSNSLGLIRYYVCLDLRLMHFSSLSLLPSGFFYHSLQVSLSQFKAYKATHNNVVFDIFYDMWVNSTYRLCSIQPDLPISFVVLMEVFPNPGSLNLISDIKLTPYLAISAAFAISA
jgi:hypothetical protein